MRSLYRDGGHIASPGMVHPVARNPVVLLPHEKRFGNGLPAPRPPCLSARDHAAPERLPVGKRRQRRVRQGPVRKIPGPFAREPVGLAFVSSQAGIHRAGRIHLHISCAYSTHRSTGNTPLAANRPGESAAPPSRALRSVRPALRSRSRTLRPRAPGLPSRAARGS